jgi:hypothetical protein
MEPLYESLPSSAMWRRVAWQIFSYILKELALKVGAVVEFVQAHGSS